MYNTLDSMSFQPFGSVYDSLSSKAKNSMKHRAERIQGQNLQPLFYHFNCDAYVEVLGGKGILLVSNNPNTDTVVEFAINRRFRVKAGVYFSIISVSPDLQLDLYIPKRYSMKLVSINRPYQCRLLCPQIQITEILGYYYNAFTPAKSQADECHSFYELVFVDTGLLRTEVDETVYDVHEKEIIVYGPGQEHTHYVSGNEELSYISIQFQMLVIGGDQENDLSQKLLNKVFPHNRKIYDRIKGFAQETATDIPYKESLMACMLTEIVIRLLQGEYTVTTPVESSIIHHNRRNELFGRIIAYIKDNVDYPVTVDEVCHKFSISRSSLQKMFLSAINQTPKRYISDLRLEKSCQLLKENNYTVTDVAKALHYSSVCAFSNAFRAKYHISPGEYAKRIH